MVYRSSDSYVCSLCPPDLHTFSCTHALTLHSVVWADNPYSLLENKDAWREHEKWILGGK